MTECNELTRYVMRSHAGFDADEARRNVRKSCGNPGLRDLSAQYDRALCSVAANHALGWGIARPKYVLRYDGVCPAFGIDLSKEQIGHDPALWQFQCSCRDIRPVSHLSRPDRRPPRVRD